MVYIYAGINQFFQYVRISLVKQNIVTIVGFVE